MFEELTYSFDLPLMQSLQGSSSLFMDQFMFTISNAWTWAPLYVMLFILFLRNSDNLRNVLLTAGFVLLCFAIVDVVDDMMVKPYFQRWRPSQDPVLKYTIHVVNGYRGGKYGFFSAHAANTMSIAVLVSLMVRSRVLTLSLLLWSFLNGFSRVYLGVHYPSDVLVGWMFGALVAVCCYLFYRQLMKRISNRDSYVSGTYTSSGFILVHCYVAAIALWLLFFYCIIKALI